MDATLLIAVAAGAATALSPCILPVLPLVLAGAPGDGRARPLGLAVGMVASFTAATLAASHLLVLADLPPTLLRTLAVVAVVAAGAATIVPRVADALARPFAPLAGAVARPIERMPGGRGGGGGLVIGAAIGLLWTPCAGPVLAATAVAGTTGDVDAGTVAMALAFAAGASVPIATLALGGRQIVRRAGRRARVASGAVLVVGGLLLATDAPTRVAAQVPLPANGLVNVDPSPPQVAPVSAAGTDLPDLGPAPPIVGITRWLGSEPLSTEALRGRVVAVQFWASLCINCRRAIPHLVPLAERYAGAGLVTIGVHTPELSVERELGTVRAAIDDLGISYPVAVDDGYATWRRWDVHAWPTLVLVDRQGRIRYRHVGEGAYAETEAAIRSLLAETA